MTDCLGKAKKAFNEIIDNGEIESIHDALQRTKDYALKTGQNLAESLEKRAVTEIENRERSIKAQQLQELISMQGTVDNLLRIKALQDAGVKNPVLTAILEKIGGSNKARARARMSTELKMNTARSKFLREFANMLHDDDTISVWTSKDHQVEIADAIIKRRNDKPVSDPTFAKIADAVIHFQDAYTGGMRELGIDISELSDRVAPNIHNIGRMTDLPFMDGIRMRQNGTEYTFTRDRWKEFTVPLLDNERILKQTSVDLTDPAQMNEFMDNTFDELVNKGKPTQNRSNIANRLAKPRVLHWKDAASIIKYNERFGTGAIQDAIVNELSSGFARLELIKDWGVSPHTALDRTFELADLDPSLKNRLNKSDEAKRIKSLLTALSGGTDGGALGDFMMNIRAFENVTKLGLVTLRSIPDLGLLATEASRAGVNGFAAIGEAVRNVFMDIHPDDRELFRDLLDAHYTHEIGSVLKYDLSDSRPGKIAAIAMRASNKLNFLEKWDARLRGTTLAILSRQMAKMRKLHYDSLSVEDHGRLGLYEMGKPEYDVIRKGNAKISRGHDYITPDSISEISDADISAIMSEHGIEGNVRKYRESVANKYRHYLEDRQAHVILRPGVLDKDLLTFGHGVPEGAVASQLFKLMSQFKMYSVNYARVPMATVLYGKGARNFREATLGGKGDYLGLAKLTAYMMALKYASMTATNLVQGLSPPSLSKASTWGEMMLEGAGIYGMASNLDFSDLPGSLGKLALGAAGGDLAKVGRLSKAVTNDVFSNDDFSQTSKHGYNLIKTAIPKYPFSAYVMNNLMMNEFADMASPGSAERYLNNLEEKTGATPLF